MSVELLRAAITASGLSQSQFAREIMVRNPSTISRWLQGKHIPETALAKLREWAPEVAKVSENTP